MEKEKKTAEQKIKCWICHRFKEPSTWVSIGATIGILAGQLTGLSDESLRNWLFTAAAVCGIFGVILSDGKKDADSK